LGTLDFYVRSVEKIINRNAGGIRPRCTLEPLQVTLAEFAGELVRGTKRKLAIDLDGVDLNIDPHLLPTAEGIVQSMVRDAFERTETGDLGVRISVEQRNGALHWRFADDGNNLISDSRLDHDDYLAFYPGQKQVMHALSECRGILSVEPQDGRVSRFEFTLPVSREPESLVSWAQGEQAFVVRASQLLDLVSADDARRGSDAYGEFFELDGRRVPLLRLDLLYSDAPGAGSQVAVLGAIEKRIAVYVPDEGTPRTGAILGDTTSVWKGPPQPVARLDGNRVPVLDTDAILGGYLGVTGAVGHDHASGGVMEDELETIQSQAASQDAQAPPALWAGSTDSGTDPIEVLVVEQSAAMRGELTSILSQNQVKAAFVGRVEEAVDVIQSRAPRLIISEFRMPSMAAKKLVDKLKNEGWHIPVLVTTSQKGKTADLLVEKLGVNGYLSKPLEAEDVATRIQDILSTGVS
jgi:CheY-like chemotaxis protein